MRTWTRTLVAVPAGAGTIEHGHGASEAPFRLMLERKTAYAPS